MKRDCYDCKALYSVRGDGDRCTLRYKLGHKRIYVSRDQNKGTAEYVDTPIPLEECPKPRTYKQLYDCDEKK
jgi:hypothetical protein